MKKIAPLAYSRTRVTLIDQRKLPGEVRRLQCRNAKDIFNAIRTMKIRGAPAIGVAAAFGVFLAARSNASKNKKNFITQVEHSIRYLSRSRPTAVNAHKTLAQLKECLYKKAVAIMRDDQRRSIRMGAYGAQLLRHGDCCLTICNAGGMATSGYGSALAVFFKAQELKKRFEVIACETRPLLQGARITTWELTQAGIKTSLICDSMAASLMKCGCIQKIFVGADRITMRGDFANKIGTYNLAVLAGVHRIPFYVVAPLSTFDKNLEHGADIPIEYRVPEEVTSLYFKSAIAPKTVGVINPAFDVTEARLVRAFITEKGIIKPPFKKHIKKILSRRSE